MRERELGKTGIVVTELSLGTWGLTGEAYTNVAADAASRIIGRAMAMGITLFETSDSYGKGKIETELGKALEGKEATVVTKWGTDVESKPPLKRFEPEYLERCAIASRERLGDSVKMVGLLHNPSAAALEKGDAIATMKKLHEEGVIASWGVSVGSEEVANLALDAEAPILSFPYNILQVQPLRKLDARLVEAGTGVLAHSLLFYGLLAGRWSPGRSFRITDHRSDRWAEGSLATRIRQLDGVRPLISGDVTTMRSAAIRFVLMNSTISSAVLGPRTPAQLDQLIRENQGEQPYLSDAKMQALENRLLDLEVER